MSEREKREQEGREEREEQRSARETFGEGVRAGLGILSGFKEAIEETIDEARERGDLSPERAKEIARTAIRRAQDAAEDARDRFDLVPRKEFETLREEVREIADRVEALEDSLSAVRPASGTPDGEDRAG